MSNPYELLRVEIEKGGRLRIEAKDQNDQYVRVNQADEIFDTQASLPIVVGVPRVFTIPNLHFSDSYDISCTNGTVAYSASNLSTLTYTAATEGYGEIKVNGTIKSFTVIADKPLTPEITYPAQGAIDLPDGFEITTSPFQAVNPAMTHYATRWQIATDPEFTDVVYDQTSTTDLVDMVTFGLDEGTPYYIRAQHIGTVP